MRESLKPIEAGCLAMVKLGSADGVVRGGSVVTVVQRCAPLGKGCAGCGRSDPPRWDIAEAPEYAVCECALIRIDPDDEQREEFKTEAVRELMKIAEKARETEQ